jgi:hypothetical protein
MTWPLPVTLLLGAIRLHYRLSRRENQIVPIQPISTNINCASVEKPPADVPFAFETPTSVNRDRPQTLALHCILVLGVGNHYG